MLAGGSYGGYLTLMGLTRQPDLWRAGGMPLVAKRLDEAGLLDR